MNWRADAPGEEGAYGNEGVARFRRSVAEAIEDSADVPAGDVGQICASGVAKVPFDHPLLLVERAFAIIAGPTI